MPRKDSTETCQRNMRNRNTAAKNIIGLMAGGSQEAFSRQTASIIKSIDQEERQKILETFTSKATIPSEHVAAMKATLNLPCNQMKNLSRWLRTFNVKLASEKNTRIVAKEWIGDGLTVELAPLTAKSKTSRRVVIILTPWPYLYNLVGHILQRLTNFKQRKLNSTPCVSAQG